MILIFFDLRPDAEITQRNMGERAHCCRAEAWKILRHDSVPQYPSGPEFDHRDAVPGGGWSRTPGLVY
jgi:hypothetical protein